MLYVNFTQGNHPKIPRHQRIPFDEAVELSQNIEMEMRDQNDTIPAYFYVLDDDLNEEMYEGRFTFGSKQAPNLFMHIKNNLPKIRTSKEKERMRLGFLEDMEALVEEKYKFEEQISPNENVDANYVSRLKRWQRKTVYGVAAFFVLASIGLFSFFIIQLSSVSAEMQEVTNTKETQEAKVSTYQDALMGDEQELLDYYKDKDPTDLSTQERNIYASFLADKEQFQQMNKLFDNKATAVEFIRLNKNTDTLQAYHDAFPTDEGAFELAYQNGNYEKVMNTDNVDMTNRRSEMLAKAHLHQDDVEGAEQVYQNHQTDGVRETIDTYQEHQSTIDDLNSQIDDLDEDEDADKIEELEQEKEEAEQQQNDL
ncbi:hypothetical protein [uncultured Marinococcus sp.]|uniref:hypothetical protein n=1 Tax=uncultured Marinococcus sp. TaxID=487012 RepID=UPI002624C3FD|nr:hypothetical protein [uncultured Marinococcus sp.]